MKARVALLSTCAALIVATCLLNFWPEPDRFPFLKGTERRLLERHEMELWNHSGHQRMEVRTYALQSARRPLLTRLTNELNNHPNWHLGGAWGSPGFSWSAKDDSVGLSLSRFPPMSPGFKNGGVINPEGYLVTYEPKRLSLIDHVKEWWRLHQR